MAQDKVWLRIIQINDVYELGNLLHFKTLVDEKSKVADKTLVVLAGDFLGPSLLSSLDKGRGMVDTLNTCGITHVSIGNHETDVPMHALADRIMESKFKWINTNMRQLDDILDIETDSHDVIEITHDNKYTKKVGLIGLLTDEKSVYRPGSFGGATIEPVLTATEKELEVLKPLNLDMIIPLTHQRMNYDRNYCKKFKGSVFPIIIGGHDHEPYDETVEGSRIIKTGMDGENAAIIDITWNIGTDGAVASDPEITVDMVPTNTYPPDAEVEKMVKFHQRLIDELETAKLFRFDDWLPEGSNEPFSTANNRLEPTNGSIIVTTLIRMGMRAQVCLMNAGNIRGAKVYPKDQEWFTWKDLKAEIAFPTEMSALSMPGKVIEDAINYSRRLARQDPPIATGAYLHHCDNVKMDENNGKILEIQGQPFDPERKYLVTLPGKFFAGLDNHVPLLEWAKRDNIEVEEENGKPAKLVVVETFSALLWLEMGSFDAIDENGDGVLTRNEVRSRAVQVFGEDVADMVVDSVFSVADLNHKGVITPVDMMVIQFVATDILDHVVTEDELATMQKVASEVLGKHPSHDEVKNMIKTLKNILDADGNGQIDREETMKVIGEVRRSSLLC